MITTDYPTYWVPTVKTKDGYLSLGLPKPDFNSGYIELTFLFNDEMKDYYIDSQSQLYCFHSDTTGSAARVEINKFYQHVASFAPFKSKALYIPYDGTSNWAKLCNQLTRRSESLNLHPDEWVPEDLLAILESINKVTKAKLSLRFNTPGFFNFGVDLDLIKTSGNSIKIPLTFEENGWYCINPPVCLRLSNGLSVWDLGLNLDEIVTQYLVPYMFEDLDLNVPTSIYQTQKRLIPAFN